ncbi:hypothetical protein [uncultured Peptoniphilus sp.]|uniref:hypothetical protein n=1 Tax=uncultured Peptoniphilus sp. TaxID=254354 RepID=UPI002804A0BF|nr:hypothetical protein [uncultured Peptoniphilus sp.]
MKLLIFSDALDPWSWGLEGILRAIDFTYENFSYEFIMTGLINNYEEFLPQNFSQLNSVELGNKILFDMYKASSTITRFPHFEKIPHLFTEEYKSSFPLDKYYVTVRESFYEKSNLYMRKLKEYAILRDKNIFLMEVQREILKELDIDFDDFIGEYEFIDEIFLEDRMKSFDYRVKMPPAFLVDGNKRLLKNFQTYEKLCEFLEGEGDLKKKDLKEGKELLFIKSYPNVLESEFLILFKGEDLEKLISNGKVAREKIGNGNILKIL